MNGAREYATMFSTGQHGRLFLVCGEHARGKTFYIWVLPTDTATEGSPRSVKDAVEVYGITGGHPGWTETYGWLHRGKWEQDFAAMVKKRRAEIAAERNRREYNKATTAQAERQRKTSLLAKY